MISTLQLAGMGRRDRRVAASSYDTILLALNNNEPGGTTSFLDQSSYSRTLTRGGDTVWDAANPPSGMTSSVYFDGSSAEVSAPSSTDFDFGTGDFAIETMARFNSTSSARCLMSRWTEGGISGSSYIWYVLDNVIVFYVRNPSNVNVEVFSVTHNLTVNTWYHLAIARTGSTVESWTNGSRIVSTANSADQIANGGHAFRVGAYVGQSQSIQGHMACARLTKGSNRGYTGATITVPTLPLSI